MYAIAAVSALACILLIVNTIVGESKLVWSTHSSSAQDTTQSETKVKETNVTLDTNSIVKLGGDNNT
jgi:hypothetical protein